MRRRLPPPPSPVLLRRGRWRWLTPAPVRDRGLVGERRWTSAISVVSSFILRNDTTAHTMPGMGADGASWWTLSRLQVRIGYALARACVMSQRWHTF